jgi:AraC-like DNA-binding protein
MNVSYPIPAAYVSDYVQSIMVIENQDVTAPFALPLFANGTPALVFQTAKGYIKDKASHLTLFGQSVLPDKLLIRENFTLVAYFLKPYSLMPVFNLAAHELVDKPVDFHLLSAKARLQEQLLHAATTRQMLRIMDNYLLGLIKKVSNDAGMIRHATEKIVLMPHKDTLLQVQNDLHITERSFQRLFEKNIGISPVQFRRINQFNKAFGQLNKKQFRQLSDIAYEHHYADQSHYIRAFKEFTGITPKEYLNLLTS